MKETVKSKAATIAIIVITVLLAGVAIFTAIRLYQLRQESIAPSESEAASGWPECQLGEVTHDVAACRNHAVQYKGVSGPSSDLDSAWLDWAKLPPLPLSDDTACGLAPSACAGPISCQAVSFTITQPSVTVTESPTITPTTKPNSTPTPTHSNSEPPVCPAAKPDAPTITSVVKNGTQATVSWTAVDLATHYTISYGTSTANYEYGVPNTGNVTSYTVKNLDASTTYYFVVYAVNDCMPSDASTPKSSVAGTGTQTALPDAGISLPTVLGLATGALVIIGSLLLAL